MSDALAPMRARGIVSACPCASCGCRPRVEHERQAVAAVDTVVANLVGQALDDADTPAADLVGFERDRRRRRRLRDRIESDAAVFDLEHDVITFAAEPQ